MDMNTNDRIEHTFRGGGPVHSWDCPPCTLAAAKQQEWAEQNNPHRAGTKVAAEWLRLNGGNRPWMDPRYETYWSM